MKNWVLREIFSYVNLLFILSVISEKHQVKATISDVKYRG